MKKYICPKIDIQKASYQLMAGSPDAYKEVGQGQFDNSGFFDETEETNPQKDNSVWE